MAFEVVRDALTTTLKANTASRFSTDTFQRQSHGAEELVGNNRHVSVYYRSGQFEKGRSGMWAGPFKHSSTFAVELLLAAPSKADLNVLNPQNIADATPQQLMSALAAMQEAGEVANLAWDELARIVWQILMEPVNENLGLTGRVIEDRWISNISKEAPSPMGEYVLLGGTMDYTCTIVETVAGEIAVPGSLKAVDSTLTETIDLSGTPADPALQGAKVGT
jgi:hypothetical protein